ncbi:MAG: hypothetical protein ACQEQU_05350 [Spirochaetota bacterium]
MKKRRPDLFISEAVDQSLGVLNQVYGEQQIAMAALYGSAAKGNFVAEVSDVNMFVVIKEESPEKLIQASEAFGGLLEQYQIQLVIMTEQELRESADVYPLEHLEIRETMQLLAGENLLVPLLIDRRNFRYQIEQRLRGGITTLRQLILLSGGRKKPVLQQFLIWCGKQDTLLRALIRLKDEQQLSNAGSEAGPRVAQIAAQMFGVDEATLGLVYELRESPKQTEITRGEIAQLLMVYEQLAHQVNEL